MKNNRIKLQNMRTSGTINSAGFEDFSDFKERKDNEVEIIFLT